MSLKVLTLEEYIVKKQDDRIDSLERKAKELSARLEKIEQRSNRIDDEYVDLVWFEKVLAKLHPEIKQDNWFEDV